MILYQYPNTESQKIFKNTIMERHNEKMKIDKLTRRNICIAVAIALLSFFTDSFWAKILLICIGFILLLSWFALLKAINPKNSKEIKTIICDDRIINTQYNYFGNRLYKYEIPYSAIKGTKQTLGGYLEFRIIDKEICLASFTDKKGNVKLIDVKQNIIIKIFDSKTKYFLLKEMCDKISYHYIKSIESDNWGENDDK